MHEKIRIRTKTLYTWVTITILILILYLFKRELFDITFLQGFVNDNRLMVVTVYLIILSLIGLLFIPSTPFAIAGVILFSPWEAYMFNLIGIITSSTIVYYFTQYLRLNRWIEARFPEKTIKVREALNKKVLPIIAGWSFFPVVPTDLIIYVASTLSIPYWKCVLGVLIGEGILNACYIFSIDLLIGL